ncbi:MAG: HlyD family efflux transporter periplasmic adaptor subunit [Pseudomonadota bacterium]
MAEVRRHADAFTTLAAIGLPSVTKAIAVMLLFVSVAIGVFLVTVPWVQTTSGAGRITALNPNDRQQEINALVSGRIDQWYVQDGMHVKVGDPIVKIIDNDPQLLDRLRAERAQVQAKLQAAEQAQRTAEIDERRTRELYEQGLESKRTAEQAQIRVDTLRSSVAEAAAELSRVDINISRLSVQTVRAPRDGVILSVNAGDAATFMSAGSPVATFVPDNVERAIEAYVDGRDVALVTPGRRARIQFEGWPAVQFSGWPSVAVGTFGARVVAVDASAQTSGLFRVLLVEDKDDLHPWPSENFVRFGSKVHAWILLDEVTVGYEIWRQLNNFPPDFVVADNTAQ